MVAHRARTALGVDVRTDRIADLERAAGEPAVVPNTPAWIF